MSDYTYAETLLKVTGVSLRFKEKRKEDKVVLRDINLEIKNIIRSDHITGQVYTLLARSGVGKTTLLKIMAGLQAPTHGNVTLGADMHMVTPGEIGMVLQNYPLFEHRTVRANMELVSSDKDKITYFLNEFDVLEHEGKYPVQLSGGQRQRAAIVQQLLCSNNFIFLDEPFSGLDPVATEKLTQNLVKVANLDDRNTVIMSSHILEPAMAISDTVIMLGHEYSTDILKTGETKWKIPGATILYKEDLAADGLAWNPDIRRDRRFIDMCENIRDRFKSL